MDNYTMTFKFDGCFDLPDDPEIRNKKLPEMVLFKLANHEFELIDFNLTKHYTNNNAKAYIKDPRLHRSVLEIGLDLSKKDLISREAIYNKCLKALQTKKVVLAKAIENQDSDNDILQSIIRFQPK